MFNGDDVKEIGSITGMNLQIGLQMATATFTIMVIMFIILFLGGKYNENVHEARLIYLNTSGLPEEPGATMFLPKYLFYIFFFLFAFISTIVMTLFISNLLVKSFDSRRLANDPKYVYVCSKLLMIVNLILFVLFFEFLKPSTKVYYE